MARYKNKLFDSITGSLGPAVVYQMYGKTYVRTKPEDYKDRKSKAQLSQRQKFMMVMHFLKPFKDLLRISFASQAIGRSAYHAAQSYNLKNGLMGEYPGYLIDLQEALLSYGPLPLPEQMSVVRQQDGFEIKWQTDSLNKSPRGKDMLIVIGQPIYGQHDIEFRFTGICRSDQQFHWVTALSEHPKIHLWIAFQNQSQTEMSNSLYLGVF